MMTATQERQPHARRGWEELPPALYLGESVSVWQRGRLRVISQLDEIETNGWVGPTWLLSVSRKGTRRPNNKELHRVLRDFAMPQPWDEDNHEPGRARKVFCPVPVERRTSCECKTDEILVVEPDGYTWSKKRVTTPDDDGGTDA